MRLIDAVSPLWYEETQEEELIVHSEIHRRDVFPTSICGPTVHFSAENRRNFLELGNKRYFFSILYEKPQLLLHLDEEALMTDDVKVQGLVPLTLEIGSIEIPLEEFLKLHTGDVVCFPVELPIRGLIRCGQIHIGVGSLSIVNNEASVSIEQIFSGDNGNISTPQSK